jgi:type II secretory pathway component PulF
MAVRRYVTDKLPIPVDYATPAPRERRPFTSIRLTMTLGFIALVEGFIANIVMPHFEQVFKDFKATLPPITEQYIGATRWLRSPIGWSFLAAVAIGIPVLVAQWSFRNRPLEQGRRRLRLLSLLVTLLAALIVGFTIVATFLPITALLDAASKP